MILLNVVASTYYYYSFNHIAFSMSQHNSFHIHKMFDKLVL